MFGLTPLGVIHTALSLVAVGAALVAFARDGRIVDGSRSGRIYLWATVLTCLTGFGIFQHGGFGKPHALGILTLLVLGGVLLAGRRRLFGGASPYIETVGWSLTFFFHMIPGVTETTTRLPLGRPLLPNAEAPQLQAAAGVLFLLFLAGATWQCLRLRARTRAGLPTPA